MKPLNPPKGINHVDKDNQFREIQNINSQLDINILNSTSRNYLDGSVYVERSGIIIGLCLDGIRAADLVDLEINSDNLPYLQDLVIRNSQIEIAPNWIKDFGHIENLILKSLHITDIDELLHHLPDLKFLALPENDLTDISSFGELKRLYRLNLNKNKFEKLPSSMSELDKLFSLTMNENYLKDISIPPFTESLQALSLRNNQIQTVPKLLQGQVFLHHLDLSSNFISHLPEWIGDLSSLDYLVLSHNQIKELPMTFGSLSKLTRLKVDHNQEISIDPLLIYELEALQEIDITNSMPDCKLKDKLHAYQKISGNKFRIIE